MNEKIKNRLSIFDFNDKKSLDRVNIVNRALETYKSIKKNNEILSPQAINDKYKHAYISCIEAQKGGTEAAVVAAGGLYKEYIDQKKKSNTLSENWNDIKADVYGIYQGRRFPNGDCNKLVQKKYKKHIIQ